MRNTFDCSQKDDGNPTRRLQDAYEELMQIEDLEDLKAKVSTLVEGSAISKKNLRKFRRQHEEIQRLDDYRMFVTNFILAGSGMGTLKL